MDEYTPLQLFTDIELGNHALVRERLFDGECTPAYACWLACQVTDMARYKNEKKHVRRFFESAAALRSGQ